MLAVSSHANGQLVRRFLEAYGAGDLDTVRAGLAEDLVAYVTNAQGGADAVGGREPYMARLPDLRGAGGSLTAKELHNFAAFLVRLRDGLVTHMWMVDARPAYSDEFWS